MEPHPIILEPHLIILELDHIMMEPEPYHPFCHFLLEIKIYPDLLPAIAHETKLFCLFGCGEG
jgi:hypothetical protein